MTFAINLRSAFLTAGVTALLAGCVSPPPRPPVRPAPAPSPVATPRPRPAPPQQASWIDWPITPGDWVYRQDARGSIALFGSGGADALVTLRCDSSNRAIYLSRASAATAGSQMTLRASTMAQSYPAQPTGGTPPYQAVTFAPRDPMLDALAFSRGRFLVELAGEPALPLPAWPEVARVLEDCR